ncbi:group II truncated hemoglobin [Viridibacterium curvum]|uniref:Group II truncated hemoglobin n=1 Tax=Viridibacterium curvum TaxID=1101404 RepID=A0ABP9R734_9RHOO
MNTPIAPIVASAPSTDNPANPHFTRIGGVPVIAQLVERFYFHMDTLPEAARIRAMHPPNLGPVKQVLVGFLTEWMGGPQAYSVERGHPRLRRKHLPFPIGAAERDAWMLCMRTALQETVQDTALIAQLEQAFFKTADFIRNDEDHHHDHHR